MVLAGCAAAVGLLSTAAGSAQAANVEFSDVMDQGKYYFNPVYWAVGKSITNGATATTFNPDGKCTRGQIITFLYNMAGKPAASAETDFTDVDPNKYYVKAISWAVKENVTKGVTDTEFGPDESCSRAQAVSFLYRYENAVKGTAAKSTSAGFTDVPDTAWYAEPVAWAVESGVTKGVSATSFAPSQTCSRAQIVTFLYSFCHGEKATFVTPTPTLTPSVTPVPAAKNPKVKPDTALRTTPLSFEEDPAYACIEAKVNLTGSGEGYDAELNMASNKSGSVVGFGIQYEKNLHTVYSGFKNNTVIILENVMSHATEPGMEGKRYSYVQSSVTGQDVLLRLSYTRDGYVHGYVNDCEVMNQTVDNGVFNKNFIFAGTAACERNGCKVNALFSDVRIKCGDSDLTYGVLNGWSAHNANGITSEILDPGETITELGPTMTGGGIPSSRRFVPAYKAKFRISGTASVPADVDWDTAIARTGSALGGTVNIAQQQY